MLKRNTYINFGKAADHSIDYLLGILDDARITTLQTVKRILPHEIDWQYTDGWNSIGALLSHIIACEHVFRIEFIEGREMTTEEEELYVPGLEMGKYIPQLIENRPLESYAEALNESRKQMIEAILKIDKATFFEKRKGYNPETGYNLAWVLYHLAEDEVHHRGQITIIRKLYKRQHS